MALTQLAPPYPIFTDKNGDPLDAGYLYFGVENLNPETNPIQVYYDSALTQPAAQPLRTSNGYVMRNGSPALIYADSQFSVTIRDKKGSLVIYSPVGYGVDLGVSDPSISRTVAEAQATSFLADTYEIFILQYAAGRTGGGGRWRRKPTQSAPSYGLDGVGWLQDADGVYWEPAPDQQVCVRMFGAVGDGTTDDATAFNVGALYATNVSKRLHVPAADSGGYWSLGSTWVLQTGVHYTLSGAGARNFGINEIRPTSAVSVGVYANECDGLWVQSLMVDMQYMPDNSIGISSRSNWHDTWERCGVYNNSQANSIGWKIFSESSASQGNYWSRFADCGAISKNDAGTGWLIQGQSVGPTRLTTLLFQNCIANENNVGIDIDYTGSGVRFIGGAIEANAGDGINVANLSGGTQINMSDMEMGSNGGFDINCATGSLVTVDNMVLLGSGAGTINGPVGWREGNGMRPGEAYSYWGAERFYSSPNNQTMTEAGGNIATAIGSSDEFTTVKTDGNPGTITANPAIALPPLDLNGNRRGMLKIVRGGSNTATVTIPDGNGVRLLNDTPVPLGLDDIQIFFYDANQASSWVEINRWTKTDGPWTLSNISTDRSINTSDISGLNFSSTPTRAECEALRDAVAGLADSVGTLISDIKEQGLAR